MARRYTSTTAGTPKKRRYTSRVVKKFAEGGSPQIQGTGTTYRASAPASTSATYDPTAVPAYPAAQFGQQPHLQYGRIAVDIDDRTNTPNQVRYLSPEGVPLATTNFNAADILRTATSAGIDLQELRGLGEKLNAAGVNYLPNQMFPGTGSNLGIDLADLASGGLGTAYDWREDPLAHLKGPFAVQQLLANRQLAEDLNLTPNTNLTSVANSLTPYTPRYGDLPPVFQLPYTAPTPLAGVGSGEADSSVVSSGGVDSSPQPDLEDRTTKFRVVSSGGADSSVVSSGRADSSVVSSGGAEAAGDPWRDFGTPDGLTDKQIRREERRDRQELRSAQSSEIKMLESVLASQGLSKQQINQILNAERQENKRERTNFANAQKASGLQLWNQQFERPATASEFAQMIMADPQYMAANNLTPDMVQQSLNSGRIQDAINRGDLVPPSLKTGNNYSDITADLSSFNVLPDVRSQVIDRLGQGAEFLREYNLPQLYKSTSGNATISTGLGLEKAYALSQAAADGTITADELVGDFYKQGGADRWAKRFDLMQQLNSPEGLTQAQLAEILPGKKIKPIKGQEDRFRVKLEGNEKTNLMGVLQYDPTTQTYKPTSYVPTSVKVDDGGFLSSPLGQILIGGALSLVAGPLVGKLVSGIANPALQGAARGAIMGGLRAGVTGGDVLRGVLSGGVGGGVGNYVGGLESVRNLNSVFPSIAPYFDLPSAVASGAGNLAGAAIGSDFDPLATLGAGAAGFVGSGIGGVRGIPYANASPFSQNVQNALASGAANFTNSLIQSGGDVNTALQSGLVSGAGAYVPTTISSTLQNQGVPEQTANALGRGLTNYAIGTALGNPNASQIGIQSGLQTYVDPFVNRLFGAAQNQVNQFLTPGQQQAQQPAYMTYNPFR